MYPFRGQDFSSDITQGIQKKTLQVPRTPGFQWAKWRFSEKESWWWLVTARGAATRIPRCNIETVQKKNFGSKRTEKKSCEMICPRFLHASINYEIPIQISTNLQPLPFASSLPSSKLLVNSAARFCARWSSYHWMYSWCSSWVTPPKNQGSQMAFFAADFFPDKNHPQKMDKKGNQVKLIDPRWLFCVHQKFPWSALRSPRFFSGGIKPLIRKRLAKLTWGKFKIVCPGLSFAKDAHAECRHRCFFWAFWWLPMEIFRVVDLALNQSQTLETYLDP